MKETLTVLTRAQLALVTACAAVIAFSCTRLGDSSYGQILRLLQLLPAVTFDSSLTKQLDDAFSQKNGELAEYRESLAQDARHRFAGRLIAPDSTVPRLALTYGAAPHPAPPRTAQVLELRRFTFELWQYFEAPPDRQAFPERLSASLPDWCSPCSVDALSMGGSSDTFPTLELLVRHGNMSDTLELTVPPDIDIEQIHYAILRALDLERYNSSARTAAAKVPWMGDLDFSPLWIEVRFMPINEAVALLRRYQEAQNSRLSVLGLDLNIRLALLGAPLVITALLGYLLVQLVHLRELIDSGTVLVADHGWAPLYKGWAGTVSAALILGLLPMFALAMSSVLTLRPHWAALTTLSFGEVVSLLLVALGLVLAIALVARVLKLRSAWRARRS